MALEIMHFDFYIICVVIGCSYIKCFTIDLVAAKWFLRKTGFYASQMTGGEDRLRSDLYKLCYCVKQIPYCTKLAARYLPISIRSAVAGEMSWYHRSIYVLRQLGSLLRSYHDDWWRSNMFVPNSSEFSHVVIPTRSQSQFSCRCVEVVIHFYILIHSYSLPCG